MRWLRSAVPQKAADGTPDDASSVPQQHDVETPSIIAARRQRRRLQPWVASIVPHIDPNDLLDVTVECDGPLPGTR